MTYHPFIKYQIILVWKCVRIQLFCLLYNCGLLDVIFCININWTKCFQINLDLEHDVLCIIGLDIKSHIECFVIL